MKTRIKSVLTKLIFIVVGTLLLSACNNTVRGVGQDIQAMGTPDDRTTTVTTVRTTNVESNY